MKGSELVMHYDILYPNFTANMILG